jgi:hypothetical protein
MTLDWLTNSLHVHQLKLKYAQRKLDFFRNKSKRPAAERHDEVAKWLKAEQEAKTNIALRQKQIVSKKAANKKAAAATTGVTTYDGVPCAAWLVPHLDWARHTGHGGVKWMGKLVSGFRDPAYSKSLCMKMCGAPACPGKCAGLTSNHSGSAKPNGAVDVTDYVTFGQLMEHCPYEPRIHNALQATDPVHFSVAGN